MKRAQEEWKHDIVYDPKRSQGHKSSVTYFMNPNVTVIKKILKKLKKKKKKEKKRNKIIKKIEKKRKKKLKIIIKNLKK